jgi:ParB-like chromosome segregation protein Spo0J
MSEILPALRPQPTGRLKFEYVNPCHFKQNPFNVRVHSRRQLKKLEASIREYGFVSPAVVDGANILLAGHARVEAAKNIGLATVPCIRAEHLNGAQKRAFTLADNRLTEEAEWNFQLLAKELQFLSDLEFNIELTGFSSAEIDLIIDDGKASAESDPA